MSTEHMDAEKWNDGNGISIVHRRLVYHFKELQNGYVELTCADDLASDESYRGEQLPGVPREVHKRLSAEGKRLIA